MLIFGERPVARCRIAASLFRAVASSAGEVDGQGCTGAGLLDVVSAGWGGRGCRMPLPQPISHPWPASKWSA